MTASRERLAARYVLCRVGTGLLPTIPPDTRTLDLATFPLVIEGSLRTMPQLLPHECALLGRKLVILMKSCYERQFGQWEHTGWLDLVEYARVPLGRPATAKPHLSRWITTSARPDPWREISAATREICE